MNDKALILLLSGVLLIFTFTIIILWLQARDYRQTIYDPDTGFIALTDNLQRDLTNCRANQITVEQAIAKQNQAIAKYEQRVIDLRTVIDEMRIEKATSDQYIEEILNRKSTGDACKAVDSLILEIAGE